MTFIVPIPNLDENTCIAYKNQDMSDLVTSSHPLILKLHQLTFFPQNFCYVRVFTHPLNSHNTVAHNIKGHAYNKTILTLSKIRNGKKTICVAFIM